MSDPKVSVVLPTYNGSRFIAEAVDSILGQTYRNLELIVVDDGSTDDTPEILSGYRDPRMRVVRQPNLWIGYAINSGVSVATGEYIAGMSHDDISLPERLSTQIAEMQRRHLDVCFTWAEIIDDRGQPISHHMGDVFNQSSGDTKEIIAKLQQGNFLLAPSVVRRRECFHHYALNTVLFGHQDYALWLQMLRQFRAAVLEVPLVKYRVHDSNVSLRRFNDEYRQLEVQASRCLANDPPFPSSSVARSVLARRLLDEARLLNGNSDSQFDAYLAAVRAVNLAPTDRAGYDVLAGVLSSMGHAEPAQITRSIGERVDERYAYPIPLQTPNWGYRVRDLVTHGWRRR